MFMSLLNSGELTCSCRTTQIQSLSRLQHEIPPQVLRQQPVYLWDAKGAQAPFYLEFVTSMEVSPHYLRPATLAGRVLGFPVRVEAKIQQQWSPKSRKAAIRNHRCAFKS